METNQLHISDSIGISDKANINTSNSSFLHGHLSIYRRNKKTGETKLWDEGDNVITISGMQTILMKILNLYLDSYHSEGQSSESYIDNRGRDTNLVIPDLNESMSIGTPANQYSTMSDDIGVNHFIQGFMVGTGGAGEDSITTKNTNYSFTNLRRPIPFQQSQNALTGDKAGKYLGIYQQSNNTVKSYFIKKFDSLPKIYHSWWVDGQRWDYIDPVTRNDLGPNAFNGQGKTNRIETYGECKLSIDESDCKTFFEASGNNETAKINEIGLVAFDTTNGTRSMLTILYNKIISQYLDLVFDNNRIASADTVVKRYASVICETFDTAFSNASGNIGACSQLNLANFYSITSTVAALGEEDAVDYTTLQTAYGTDTNIGVNAFYNQNGTYQYENDSFLSYLTDTDDRSIAALTDDEAQRVKLITYYTFNSIPLEENWEILIDYRLYAN